MPERSVGTANPLPIHHWMGCIAPTSFTHTAPPCPRSSGLHSNSKLSTARRHCQIKPTWPIPPANASAILCNRHLPRNGAKCQTPREWPAVWDTGYWKATGHRPCARGKRGCGSRPTHGTTAVKKSAAQTIAIPWNLAKGNKCRRSPLAAAHQSVFSLAIPARRVSITLHRPENCPWTLFQVSALTLPVV
jgi:hypothetical protein